MAADTEDLILTISADVRQMQRALTRVVSDNARTTAAIQKQWDGVGDLGATGFDNIGRKAGAAGNAVQAAGAKIDRAMSSSRLQTANVAAQFNDIGVQLAGGQSPLLIALQQGTQISQALGQSGATGAVKALGGAFLSLVSPIQLGTIALIALSGYAIQYLSTWLNDAPDVNELLKQHGELIKSFDDAYGIAAEGAKKYSDAVRAIELQKIKDQFGDLQKALKDAAGDVAGDVLGKSIDDFGGATAAIQQFSDAVKFLEQDTPDLRSFAQAMIDIENEFNFPEKVRKLAKEFRLAAQESLPLQDAVDEINKRLDAVYLTGEKAKALFATLTGVLTNTGTVGGTAIDVISGKITNELIPSLNGAMDVLKEYMENYSRLQGMVESTPLGTLTPLTSGGGNFLNPEELQRFKADEASLRQVGASLAAQLIKGFESFSANAYADTRSSTGEFDAYRVGYGSDTATRANGMIEKVTKSTIVTLEDAQRDLSRRILEFQSGIQQAIGSDTWRSLSEGQQAALTSIAYNYGTLPKKIVDAIKAGGGPEVVAQAIASLSANPKRRREEAQAYLGGTPFSMADAGLTQSKRRTPEDLFKGSTQEVQQRIDMLNAEIEAQGRLNPLINDYGFAVEKARIAQQLLSEAKRAGLEITPELAAQIDQLAGNYAKAAAEADKMKESQQRANQAAAEFGSLAKDALGGFIRDLMAGKSAAEALGNALQRIGERLLDMALESLFSGIFGGGGLFGGLFGSTGGKVAGNLLVAGGGRIAGPGSSTSDSIPARLSNGEFVVQAKEAKKVYPLLEAINSGKFKGYREGGMVGDAAGKMIKVPAANTRSSSVQSGGVNVTFSPMVDARGADVAAVARLERSMAKMQNEFHYRVVRSVKSARSARML